MKKVLVVLWVLSSIVIIACTKDSNPEWTKNRNFLCGEVLPAEKSGVALGKTLMSKNEFIARAKAQVIGNEPGKVVIESLVTSLYDSESDNKALAHCSDALLAFDPDGSKSATWIKALKNRYGQQ